MDEVDRSCLQAPLEVLALTDEVPSWLMLSELLAFWFPLKQRAHDRVEYLAVKRAMDQAISSNNLQAVICEPRKEAAFSDSDTAPLSGDSVPAVEPWIERSSFYDWQFSLPDIHPCFFKAWPGPPLDRWQRISNVDYRPIRRHRTLDQLHGRPPRFRRYSPFGFRPDSDHGRGTYAPAIASSESSLARSRDGSKGAGAPRAKSEASDAIAETAWALWSKTGVNKMTQDAALEAAWNLIYPNRPCPRHGRNFADLAQTAYKKLGQERKRHSVQKQ